MNAFEELIGGLLRREGLWTHHSYRVELAMMVEKLQAGKAS